jgi:hypothetical protein
MVTGMIAAPLLTGLLIAPTSQMRDRSTHTLLPPSGGLGGCLVAWMAWCGAGRRAELTRARVSARRARLAGRVPGMVFNGWWL